MQPSDLMRDPHFAGIMYRIEYCVHEFDRLAAQETDKPSLKDTEVKSALRKVIATLRNNPGRVPGPKDAVKVDLSEFLLIMQQELEAGGAVSRGDFIKSLFAVEDSLKTRREMTGHSRGYLDFLKEFLAQEGL
jgi:hypothetical protein